jgi:hypothetical protein
MASAEPPEHRAGILYIDTSALLKLLVREAESAVIERELVLWPNLATSIVTEVELPPPAQGGAESGSDGGPTLVRHPIEIRTRSEADDRLLTRRFSNRV